MRAFRHLVDALMRRSRKRRSLRPAYKTLVNLNEQTRVLKVSLFYFNWQFCKFGDKFRTLLLMLRKYSTKFYLIDSSYLHH